jgi:regulator of cell morphogenesis and NO signaling
MRDPIDRLLEEHQYIMSELVELRHACEMLSERGVSAWEELAPRLTAIGVLMTRELPAHARREDDALFPALEALLGRDESPTSQMRLEHRDLHAQAMVFRTTLQELNEVEHPAIAAGGRKLRELISTGDVGTVRRTATEILELLDLHFGKEEQILFPMARQLLDRATLDQVARQMEALDRG